MRVLVVNPNTTQSVTDALVQQARDYLGSEFEISGLTAQVGPAVVACADDVEKAQGAIENMLAQISEHADLVVLGISLDIGLATLRQQLSVPVFALSESALRQANHPQGEVVAITVGSHMLPLYADMSARYGYTNTQVHWHAIDDPSAFTPGGLSDDRKRAYVRQAGRLKERYPSASLVFVGALLAGLGAYASTVMTGVRIIEPMHAVCLDITATINPASGALNS